MGKKIEVPKGTRCGHWVVIRELKHKKSEGRKLLCKCDCGKEKTVSLYSIAKGISKSCGCYSWNMKTTNINDYIGRRYGKLVVIGEESVGKYQHIKVRCKCDCGNEKIITLNNLNSGYTKSCGCLKYTDNGVQHKCKERLYKIRQQMIQRCNNPKTPNFNNYGGRGIKVCKEWENDYFSFRNWALENGYDDSLSLDRIDVNGNYEPANCRWATRTEQANNTRTNMKITYLNETHTVSEWSRITGIKRSVINDRYKKGYALNVVFSKERLNPRKKYEKRGEKNNSCA